MDAEELRKLTRIIDGDSTNTTYKFALLRGAIEICQEEGPQGRDETGRVWFPLGLLAEKWLAYYYPIVADPCFIPQRHGETREKNRLSFRDLMESVIRYYADRGGQSAFLDDYYRDGIPAEMHDTVLALLREIRKTITDMPMRHLGYSYSHTEYYVFDYERPLPELRKDSPLSREHIISTFGRYSIDSELCGVLDAFGGFISGERSLIERWADFTVRADKTGQTTHEKMLGLLRENTCPFCNPPPNTVLRNALCYARPDKYPVSPGHLLIVPYRHIPALSEATPAEVADLLDLLEKCREYTDARHAPDGYNIGVNEGTAAGQTVMHLHIHLIPRYAGDMDDPRGGVRGVIPEKRVYPSSQKRDTLSDQN